MEPSDGATLRVDLVLAEGRTPPRYDLLVSRIGAPSYGRTGHAVGDRALRATGIGGGRFRVTVAPPGGVPVLAEEIEFDGRTEVRRTVDLTR